MFRRIALQQKTLFFRVLGKKTKQLSGSFTYHP
jgi:hypothetical protein